VLDEIADEANLTAGQKEALSELYYEFVADVIAKHSIYFFVYCPDPTIRREWNSVFVYNHAVRAVAAMIADVNRLLPDTFVTSHTALSTRNVARGTRILIVPTFPQSSVNPTQASIEWLEECTELSSECIRSLGRQGQGPQWMTLWEQCRSMSVPF